MFKYCRRNNCYAPIEKHSTAAWANVAGEKPVSKVPLPNVLDVELAREWVNQNQK
ncbi:MAG TPA: DUF3787 domain-containing protein [Firmicutes bacterium]|nr:DUF3787 domain-containing protein [Bacillota bacterium]